jgi:hypothetical protein
MRRLRRVHERHIKEQAKRCKKFKKRAIAAGTAAVITLGTGVGINKALAVYTPDPHELPVSQDADADLLANAEEVAIGYRAFKADQNRNQIPDGVELAKRCAAAINQLPDCNEADPNEICKGVASQWGMEACDICGEVVNMGGVWVTNPHLGLTVNFPILAIHYLEHGSFDYGGHSLNPPYEPVNNGRTDVQLLLRVLELRYPHDPNGHQLPLDYVVEPVGQLAPDANDLDNDLLADSEELAAGYNLYGPDQDSDLVPDGIELAKQCAVAIGQLPTSIPSDPNKPYKILYETDGVETCEICGFTMCMDHWDIVNPRLGLTIPVPVMAAHYMEHGSFSYFGHDPNPPYDPVHAGRVDIALLAKILEMPQQCGDLGTLYLPGDLNKDCKVDLTDFAEFADKWLQSTDPGQD